MNTMFDTLLLLPLFQGLKLEDLTLILEKVKLDFQKYRMGETIIKAGQPCDQMLFVLSGEVSATYTSEDGTYSLTEFYQPPIIVEAYSLFGMKTCYTSTYIAREEVSAVTISKSFVLTELLKYDIFRLNFMNICSRRAQDMKSRIWTSPEDSLESHIKLFILSHCERMTGKKSFKVKMERLAELVNDTRPSISKTLNAMQDKELIKLHRGEIFIPDIEKLIS